MSGYSAGVFYISRQISIRRGIWFVHAVLFICCGFHYNGWIECCTLCVHRYLLLFSMYLALFQSLSVWFLHTVIWNVDVRQNQFIESCTSLMWVNRYLLLFPTFLAQIQSNSLYNFSVQCSWTGVICIKIALQKDVLHLW